jgi:hypothetical protein
MIRWGEDQGENQLVKEEKEDYLKLKLGKRIGKISDHEVERGG